MENNKQKAEQIIIPLYIGMTGLCRTEHLNIVFRWEKNVLKHFMKAILKGQMTTVVK